MKQEIPYIYILLYAKLKERAISPVISKQTIDMVFDRWLRVPNIMKHNILSDMEALKLIKKKCQREWILLNSDCPKELDNFKKYGRWISSVEALE
jgi:hypothetical protein